MSAADIEETRRVLVASYKCDDSDIIWTFEGIDNEYDTNRSGFLMLVYRMKSTWKNQSQNRVIFKMKVPVPEDLMARFEEIKRASAPAITATVTDIQEVMPAAAAPPAPKVSRPAFKPPSADNKK